MQAQPALVHWLRLLWSTPMPVRPDAPVPGSPFIQDGTLHVCPSDDWHAQRAAAAHAAAHRVFSPTELDGEGLAPVVRAIYGLLEDARVELLAARELPGLMRLWRPLHRTGPEDGDALETLFARLARALSDPHHRDPHPWVAKGRALFFLDEAAGLCALQEPRDLRRVALRLGHDIGQMRRPFDARGYRPMPAYRDDHRWLWRADRPPQPVRAPPRHDAEDPMARAPDVKPPSDPSTARRDDPSPGALADAVPAGAALRRTPEWDRRIGRLRRDWCTVWEAPLVRAARPVARGAAPTPPGRSPDLVGVLRALRRPQRPQRRSLDGDAFDLSALVDVASSQRLRLWADPRIHRERLRSGGPEGLVLLVDASASTAQRRPDGRTVLETALDAAMRLGRAGRAAGLRCAIAGFQTNGRHAVRVQPLPLDGVDGEDGLPLQPAGSTRLGAVLRHVAGGLSGGRSNDRARWVLLLSDGEVHDVDVPHPMDLVADARHAVRSARAHGTRMACLAIGEALHPHARAVFGPAAVALPEVAALPARLRRLLRR